MPILFPNNVDVWTVYNTLLTQAVDPNTGLLRYDGQLIRDLCDLLEVSGNDQRSLAGKVLFMIGVANPLRLAKFEKARKEDEAKRKADALRGRSRDRFRR